MDSALFSENPINLSCKQIINDIKSSRKNSNRLVDLEELLLAEDEQTLICALDATEEILLYLINQKDLFFDIKEHSSVDSTQEQFQHWLFERYESFKAHILDYLDSEDENIAIKSLHLLMKLIQAEALSNVKSESRKFTYFPKQFLQSIVLQLIQIKVSHCDVAFKEYLMYKDVKFYVLGAIHNILNGHEKEIPKIENIFNLLIKIQYPKEFDEAASNKVSSNVFINTTNDVNCPTFLLKKKTFRKLFSSVWLLFLKQKLSSSLYRKVLIYCPKRVLPHLANPLLLTDFFTDSYNMGGVISVLALNGIFYLMQNCNLEYPDFYYKLYALFDIKIVNSKYAARFFYLADVFLSSTHLPSYLVAAFVKRLAQLALYTSPNIILVILPFIGNLLIRHPRLKVLMHNPGKPATLEDPYNFEESDPAECNAIESSLWEIKALQKHWHPDISSKAMFINSDLPLMEWDLSELLDVTMMDVMEIELESKFNNVATSYDVPTGLFVRNEDTMHNFWTTSS